MSLDKSGCMALIQGCSGIKSWFEFLRNEAYHPNSRNPQPVQAYAQPGTVISFTHNRHH